MAISEYHLEEIMNDEQISPAARQLLFAAFDHRSQGDPADPQWIMYCSLLAELEAAGYLMRGDAWKGQTGGHYMLFDRSQAPTVASRLPAVPPKHFGREVLYVVGQPGTAIVKIGRSTNMPLRLRAIQTGSPVPLSVLWWHPGGQDLERYLHRKYAEFRLHGEWFDFGVEEPDHLVEMAVTSLRPDEFPPMIELREDFADYFRKYPPGCRYDFLLSGIPPGPFCYPR